MIERRISAKLRAALDTQPAVALLGTRQAGKTTLAWALADEQPSIYLDLENPRDLAKLDDPEGYLSAHEEKLVILDEIHRVPGLFPVLRGIIDAGRRRGKRTGRFLLLGSAQIDLLRQSGESLAGRISYLDLSPFDLLEVGREDLNKLWLRGGYPDSFLAKSSTSSALWRDDMIRTYLERDIPQLGPRIPAETLRRFWTMLAHSQGGIHNAARIGAGLEISGQTVSRYTDLLVDLLLVRRLQPYVANVGKRLVKAPKIMIRDSGLLHSLLGILSHDSLLSHPVVGGSWEGFAIETLIGAAPPRTIAGFYRTAAGAEIDLILELPCGDRWAIEIKRSSTTKPSRGFYHACEDLQPNESWMVHGAADRFTLASGTTAIGLYDLAAQLAEER
jgi:predicted AAA+ superfamily ATPase